MHDVEKVSGAVISAAADRQVGLHPWALPLAARAGITKIEASAVKGGQIDLAWLDGKLAASDLNTAERISLKRHLTVAGVLPAGRLIDQRRP